MQDVRGLFHLDPPPGGLARLQRELGQADVQERGLPLLPWAIAALLLVMIGGAPWLRGDPADLIIADVVAHEPEPLQQLSAPGTSVGIYLARPTVGPGR